MVDLAFLLLTFFILTTTLLRTQALQLTLPPVGGEGAAPGAITVVLTRHGAYHYAGALEATHPGPARTTIAGLRSLLIAHRAAHPDAVCIVRTTSGIRYRDVISVLDELMICGIGRYTITEDLLPIEQQLIPSLSAAR